jgi:hypothetical protein
VKTFQFAFDPKWRRLVSVVAGATPDNSMVAVGDGRLVVDFGRYGIDTSLDNVKDVQITRDYAWFKAIGVRGSLADRGATYGSSTTGGVCVCFHEPLHAMPYLKSPGLTMTVVDIEGCAAAIRDAAGLAD